MTALVVGSGKTTGRGVCRLHGGKSTGARTPEGRARIAASITQHGRETRAKRAEYKTKMAELYELELLGRKVGLIVGRKSPGR